MERRLAAILIADVSGFSRLMELDEAETLASLQQIKSQVIQPKLHEFGGHVVGSAGDNLLVEFGSAINAVQCAVLTQKAMDEWNYTMQHNRQMVLRIGVNVGDVVAMEGTIHGDGVNIAARLEKLAEPGGICISHNVYDQIRGKLSCAVIDIGDQRLHNISTPVHAYKIRHDGEPHTTRSWGQRRSDSHVLNVSTIDSFASRWLVPKLFRFINAHPDIDVRLWTSNRLVNFGTENVEIAIRNGRGQYAGLQSDLLLEEYVTPICSPKLLGGEYPLRNPADLKNHTLIHDYFHIDWPMWLDEAKVYDVDWERGPRFFSSEHVIQTAVLGEGVALGRSALIADEVASGLLVVPFEKRILSPLAYYIVYPTKGLDHPMLRMFRDWLLSECEHSPASAAVKKD
jgi:class 3 adenylate cyclase/DNA-binding transcriptional LysR family regulator